jgi:hypothetical protein
MMIAESLGFRQSNDNQEQLSEIWGFLKNIETGKVEKLNFETFFAAVSNV